MKLHNLIFSLIIISILINISCREELPVELLYRFPADDLANTIDRELIEFDPDISFDNNGSIKIIADAPVIVRLFEIEDLNIHDMTLIYKAYVRTRGLKGNVFLEMRVTFHDRIRLARGLKSMIRTDKNFTEIDTIFFLKKNHFAESISLNLVIEGRGTVWIDDLRLYKGPLTFLRAREF